MPTREETTAEQEPMGFFKHISNSSQTDECLRLLDRRGYDGYGRWWRLCEHLSVIKGHRIKFETDEDVRIIARTLDFGKSGAFDEYMAIEDCKSFVSDLLDIKLLERDSDGFLISPMILENARYIARQRVNGRKGGRPRKNTKNNDSAGQDV
ncbi:hypothetical protein [Gemmiger formicilis]|uniref:hypothetical protein n=1 Tax=Gemmiger formicilis TaxID=745368 RepID=UPI003A91541A